MKKAKQAMDHECFPWKLIHSRVSTMRIHHRDDDDKSKTDLQGLRAAALAPVLGRDGLSNLLGNAGGEGLQALRHAHPGQPTGHVADRREAHAPLPSVPQYT